MIGIGQKLPDTEVLWVRESEVKKINLSQKLAGRRVAIFEMPGAFSTTCSGLHLPNIIGNKNELMKKGRGRRFDRFVGTLQVKLSGNPNSRGPTVLNRVAQAFLFVVVLSRHTSRW